MTLPPLLQLSNTLLQLCIVFSSLRSIEPSCEPTCGHYQVPKIINMVYKGCFESSVWNSVTPFEQEQYDSAGCGSSAFIVKDGRVGLVEDATAVIAQVAGCEESVEAYKKVSGIDVLVDLLDSATVSGMRTKENAVSGLLNLVRYGGEKVAGDVRKNMTRSLGVIADIVQNGNPKAKNKGLTLLKVLQDSTAGSDSSTYTGR